MEYQNIILERNEGIARLTINRPPVNVIDCDTLLEINAALEELTRDEDTKVLLIRGSGDRAFCAGVEVGDHIGDKMPVMMREFGKVFVLLRNLGKPSIAVVNGVALGGGCEIIAGCDMAIAVDKAKLGQPEISLGGLAPAAAAIFPRIMAEKKAFELILLGESISATEAERIGLVNKVVTTEELDSTADELARKFLEKSSLSIRLCREAFYQCADNADFDGAIQTGTEMGIKTWATDDGQEGLNSYMEKRSPVWKNK